MIFPALSLALLVLSGLYMGWSDIARRRLPNAVVGSLALAGLSVSYLAGGSGQFSNTLVHFALAVAIGFALFALRVFGSGDAKYYAATAAWFTLDQSMILLGAVSIAGFAIALFWIIRQRISGVSVSPEGDFAKVPFGVAIAVGAAAAALKAWP